MKLRRFRLDGQDIVALQHGDGWIPFNAIEGLADPGNDMISILDRWPEIKPILKEALTSSKGALAYLPPVATPILPFEPKSFRDFMLSEKHAIDAARGIVKRFLSPVYPLLRSYEGVVRRPFPMLKPKAIWYRQPIYYMGNHLNFVTENARIEWPSYTKALDYELEMGFVITKPLKNANREEALAAIGGFVIVNDFSARDVQLAEMKSGLGPQKAKHFINAMSAQIVPAEEILPHIDSLTAHVRINDVTVGTSSTRLSHHSIADALVHVSKAEQLHPGELFATGTLPGGCALETDHWIGPGDRLELYIERIGTLTNIIGTPS